MFSILGVKGFKVSRAEDRTIECGMWKTEIAD
jgi:hypothetical protein